MSGESQPSREAREKATVGVPGLGNKHVHTAQENSKVEADLGNNVTEPVEEIKYLETMKVFDESPKTKSDPTYEFESPVTAPSPTNEDLIDAIEVWKIYKLLQRMKNK